MAGFQTGFNTRLAARLAPADVTATLATAPTPTSGRMLLINGNITEWISYTGVSGSTITGLTRNLSTTADPATGGTGLDWGAGSQILMVVMHDQYVDKETALPIVGMTTTERDALVMSANYFTGSYPIIYNSTAGQYQYYNGSAWASFATGTVADATDLIGGKVKISTADTGNTPVVLNSTDNKYIALAGQSGTAPSVSNKFEDNADTSVTAVASKLVRGTSGSKIDPSWLNVTFGGDGSDGALAITSGATNIDLSNASVVVKNYTSVSITGTGQLTFSNPASGGTVIILRSQGAVTLTSSTIPNIDASGMGGAGGTGGAQNANGTSGTNPNFALDITNHFGVLGTTTTGGAGGVILTSSGIIPYTNQTASSLYRRLVNIIPGAGGAGGGGSGTGGTGSASGGNGGRGGGGLLIECAGALNFTSTLGVSVAGKVGTAGGDTGGTNGGAGGGGGGAAGMALILYNTLTAASGTVNTAGGAGGQGGSGGGGGNIGGGGGGGGAFGGAGGAGGTGGVGSAAGGTSAGGGGGSGKSAAGNFAGGAAGASDGGLVTKNTYFY